MIGTTGHLNNMVYEIAKFRVCNGAALYIFNVEHVQLIIGVANRSQKCTLICYIPTVIIAL